MSVQDIEHKFCKAFVTKKSDLLTTCYPYFTFTLTYSLRKRKVE